MNGKTFFDTNILIYAVSRAEDRTDRAQEVIAAGGCVSVQVLNEFANVARKKLNRSWPEIRSTLDAFRVFFSECSAITDQTHEAALQIAQRYDCSIYDALIIASAIEANCEVLLSEDMQHGQMFEGRLRVRNPFAV